MSGASPNNAAWILATARNADKRDGREAVRLALEAVGLLNTHGYNDTFAAGFADTLAAAYAETGRFDEAVAEQKRAIELMWAAGRQVDVGAARSRLDLYHRGQPYRSPAQLQITRPSSGSYATMRVGMPHTI